ncbi:unnamed protein product [Chondrus crispus]|uniref:Uncharacterized protein n=1 Tax=Chondrus crispus TaxID=2769 RepID=R7QB18_CHOCR|nr:unnamed protein product [Chondrus crispus]CDF34655.1 unnamed protein product [Chondrus crispus]|eukprot:XP_005714474.1 unnamed protein product [Chondrus crispus]
MVWVKYVTLVRCVLAGDGNSLSFVQLSRRIVVLLKLSTSAAKLC